MSAFWPSVDECEDCHGECTHPSEPDLLCVWCCGQGIVCAECGFAIRDCTCAEEEAI